MKTRRALQIIVGVLSLLVVLCLLAVAALIALVTLFDSMPQIAKELSDMLKAGFGVVASHIGLAGMPYLIPLLFYVLPGALLLLAGVLLLLPYKGRGGKYVAGNILALIGIAVITLFTILFAADLASRVNGDAHVWLIDTFSWTSTDTIVRLIMAGLLIVFVVFIGCALGVKVKDSPKTETDVNDQSAVTNAQQKAGATYETVTPAGEKQATAGKNTTEYVPVGVSVSDVTNGVYGHEKKNAPAAMDKIKKARILYDMGAITQEEFIKIVNSYLKK